MEKKYYKAFENNMTCRWFRFEIGKTYEEADATMCHSGFHFCENPLDCLRYYGLIDNKYDLNIVKMNRVTPLSKIIDTIITTYNKDNVSNMEFQTETILADKYLEYIDIFENQINSSFENYKEKNGIDINITKTNSKIVLNMIINVLSLDDETKRDLSITDTYSSYKKAKNILEQDGYICN